MDGVFVRQAELEEIAEHDREIAWRQKRSAELKSTVQVLLRGGAGVEPGRFAARLAKRFARSVPWKQCVLEKLGSEVLEAYRRLFPVRIFFEVVVTEHAVPPLWHGREDSWNTNN